MRAAVHLSRLTATHAALAAILATAVVLRVWTFRAYGLHHPDELYQYLEQAHRLVFGQGIVPWEYHEGMRSWLLPLGLTLPIRLGEAVAPGSMLGLIFAKSLVAIIALAPLAAAWTLGARLSRMHGLIAAAVTAIWFESIYFSGHVLTEVLAVACFLPAAALIRPGAMRGALAIGGALLGAAAVLRFQYGPAIGVFALMTLGTRWRDWPPVIVGGLAILAASGCVDLAMGQPPFGWIAANVRENLVEGAADRFGVAGPLAYFQLLWLHWGIATPALLLLPLLVWRRYPGLFWAAIVNLLVHMAIGHKEYRFLWLTVHVLVLLAAIASAELLHRALERRRAGPRTRIASTIALVALWAATSAWLARSGPLWPDWQKFTARMAAMADSGRQPALCGVAIHGIEYWSGSYTYLRRAVPIYMPSWPGAADASKALAAHAEAYDAVVAPAGSALPRGYHRVSCRDDGNETICVSRRAGGCTAAGHEAELLQHALERHGP